MKQSGDDHSAFIAQAPVTSDHARIFGPGEEGPTPILLVKESIDLDPNMMDALGFTINSHAIRIWLVTAGQNGSN